MSTKLSDKNLIPDADWQEYGRWLLGRRRRFIVRERSMVPTLMPGDTVFVRIDGLVQTGDIAISTHPTDSELLLIKRVQETFYDGGVYLISDNTDEATARDSRHFGVLTKDHIIGRVTSRLAAAPI